MQKTFFTFTILIICHLVLIGCVQVLPDPPPPAKVYSLSVTAPESNTWQNYDLQIGIAEPMANLMLDSDRIAIHFQETLEAPRTWEYVKGKKWFERLPRMLQSSLAEQLTRTQKLKSVVTENVTLDTDYLLLSTLYEFHIEEPFTKPAHVSLRLLVQLRDNSTQKIVAERMFSQDLSVSEKRFSAFKQTFDQAYSMLIKDILDWLLTLKLDKK